MPKAKLPIGSGVVWALLVLGLALLACKNKGHEGGAAASASAPAGAAMAPGSPFTKPGYQLRFGPSASPKDPKPSDFATSMPQGYVSMKFETDAEDFNLSALKVSLYRVSSAGAKSIETQKTSTIDPKMNFFAKSWKISQSGRYEVKVEDPAANEVLAIGQFDVTE